MIALVDNCLGGHGAAKLVLDAASNALALAVVAVGGDVVEGLWLGACLDLRLVPIRHTHRLLLADLAWALTMLDSGGGPIGGPFDRICKIGAIALMFIEAWQTLGSLKCLVAKLGCHVELLLGCSTELIFTKHEIQVLVFHLLDIRQERGVARGRRRRQ